MGLYTKKVPSAEPYTGFISYWVAVYNYFRIIFSRNDNIFSTVSDVGGFAKFNFPTTVMSGVVVGTKVYAYSQDETTYNLYGEVTAVGTNDITTDIPFVSNTSGGVVYSNLLKNYRAEIVVDVWNGTDYVPITTGPTATFANLPNGNIICELQEYLKSYLNNDYEYTSTGAYVQDEGNHVQFRVRVRENYYGATPEDYYVVQDGDDTDIDFFAVNAAMQLGDENSPNMANYVVFDTDLSAAKWLTGFIKPTYFKGFPFDVAFIYGSGDLDVDQKWLKGNTQVNVAQAAGSDYHGNICRVPLNTTYTGSFDSITLQLLGYDPLTPVSELLTIKVAVPCTNALCLVWKNKLGGWDYWVFESRKLNNYTTGNGDVFAPYVEDMETAKAKEIILSKTAIRTLDLAATNLDTNDTEGLSGLMSSPAVYIIDINGNPIQRVSIQPGTWNLSDTNTAQYELQFTIVKQSDYLQSE